MDAVPETLGGSLVRDMPAEVRALAEPWPSLVGQTPGLTAEMEKDFRFGQAVIQLGGQYRIGGNLKGGSSTLWYPATEAHDHAYQGWREQEGTPRYDDPDAYARLFELLDRNEVSLGEYAPTHGWFYQVGHEILSCLPLSHLSNPQFASLRFGGWGPDSAKGSAYDRGAVIMYEFAISGARRTFMGLFLHELGHAQQERFGLGELSILREQYAQICDAGAIMGTEYLLDARTRQIYQRLDFNEFLAETYMHYCSQGERLRRFVAALDGPCREAWEDCYAVFQHAFEGVEYA